MRSTILFSLLPAIQGVLGSAGASTDSSATISDVPYLVSIAKSSTYACAGAIIGKDRVVTTANCVYGDESSPSSFTVRVGSSNTTTGGNVIAVSKITRNAQYDSSTKDYDVAVLKLSSSITPSSTVKTIDLVQAGDQDSGTECVASGWGGSDSQLHSITLPIMNRDKCSESDSDFTARMTCAKPESGDDLCKGDRGGPFTCGGKLAGIVSKATGCEDGDLPDIMTDIANSGIRSWILNQ